MFLQQRQKKFVENGLSLNLNFNRWRKKKSSAEKRKERIEAVLRNILPPPPLSRNEIFLEMKTTGAVFFACRGRGSFGGWKVANPTTAITTSTNDDDGGDDGDRRFLSASTRPWKDVSACARVRG